VIVVDTNVLAYFLIASPLSEQANAVHHKDPEWAAPALWRSELRNVLTTLIRRGGLSLSQALRHLAEAEVTLARRQYDSDTAAVLELATRTGCTAYDCEFAALARDLGVPLVTADRRLAAAFPDIAVTLGLFTKPGNRR
jgi:predicted nucleic acid-binding protein